MANRISFMSDRTRLKWYQTNDWFNRNKILITTRRSVVGDKIKEKCMQRGISHYYGDHSIVGGDLYIGNVRVRSDRYRLTVQETGLKVKELVEWALKEFNSSCTEDVWIKAIQPQPVP